MKDEDFDAEIQRLIQTEGNGLELAKLIHGHTFNAVQQYLAKEIITGGRP